MPRGSRVIATCDRIPSCRASRLPGDGRLAHACLADAGIVGQNVGRAAQPGQDAGQLARRHGRPDAVLFHALAGHAQDQTLGGNFNDIVRRTAADFSPLLNARNPARPVGGMNDFVVYRELHAVPNLSLLLAAGSRRKDLAHWPPRANNDRATRANPPARNTACDARAGICQHAQVGDRESDERANQFLPDMDVPP